MTGIISVAAVDDHPIILDSVAGWVEAGDNGIEVVATVPTVADLLAGPGRRAHVVLLDLDLDLGDGTTVAANVAAIRAAGPGDWISPRLAFILASDEAIDKPALSHQEMRALQLYATALPVKSVARRMGLGEETVKQYLGRVREKYARAGRAAPTKLELYHRAVEDGHLPPAP